MENVLLKSKIQLIGWLSLIVLISLSILMILGNYYLLSLLLIVPIIYLIYKTPFAWKVFKDKIIVKYIVRSKIYEFEKIKYVELSYHNARLGHVITFFMKNGEKFSIDYNNEYWTEDLCFLLLRNNVHLVNNGFNWIIIGKSNINVKCQYPRTTVEIKRKKELIELYP